MRRCPHPGRARDHVTYTLPALASPFFAMRRPGHCDIVETDNGCRRFKEPRLSPKAPPRSTWIPPLSATPTAYSFASCCFPHRLAATQSPSATCAVTSHGIDSHYVLTNGLTDAPSPAEPGNLPLTLGEPMTLSPPIKLAPTLFSAPIELAGDWGHMIPLSADLVVERMRHSCLDGVRLVSDRQPTRLRVDEHTSRSPAVWLHPDGSSMAWIIVDIGEHAWVQLAYQFGHELGHVLANSWQPHAKPKAPCQWLEEAMVEAFSLRGLGRLAESWKQDPPFPGDNEFGNAIADYRRNIVESYTKLATEQGIIIDPAAWFANHRSEIEVAGLNPFAQAASLTILAEYERSPDCVEALGALNRWPGRSGVPIEEYLRLWEASCTELPATPQLPTRLREILRIA